MTLFITRDDSLVNSLIADPPTLSDHSLIIGLLSSTAAVGIDEERRVLRRRWRQFDLEVFTGDLQCSLSAILQTTPTDVDEWFAVYDRLMCWRCWTNMHLRCPFVQSVASVHHGIMTSAEPPRSSEGKLKNVIDSEAQLTT